MANRRIRIGEVQPSRLTLNELKDEHCFLGVSLENPSFSDRKAQAILRWADQRFAHVEVLIGDYPHRHNLMIHESLEANEAQQLASRIGSEVEHRIRNVIPKNDRQRFHFTTCNELARLSRFSEYVDLLRGCYQDESRFRGVVDLDIVEYLARAARRGEVRGRSDLHWMHSVEFILEELAVFALMVERGHKVQLYPGTHLRALKELASSNLDVGIAALNRQVCIDITL